MPLAKLRTAVFSFAILAALVCQANVPTGEDIREVNGKKYDALTSPGWKTLEGTVSGGSEELLLLQVDGKPVFVQNFPRADKPELGSKLKIRAMKIGEISFPDNKKAELWDYGKPPKTATSQEATKK